MSDPAPNFKGHEGRECGEHRTVGSHRAWCHDCTEWCYPEFPCSGCKIPQLEAKLQERDREIEQLKLVHYEELLQSEKDCLEETEQLAGQLNEATLEALNWKARAEQNASEWEAANKLLEQTIEVLEAAPVWGCQLPGWYRNKAKPLLDNLKARKKEAE